jgi:hypothetical protein
MKRPDAVSKISRFGPCSALTFFHRLSAVPLDAVMLLIDRSSVTISACLLRGAPDWHGGIVDKF